MCDFIVVSYNTYNEKLYGTNGIVEGHYKTRKGAFQAVEMFGSKIDTKSNIYNVQPTHWG